MQFVVEAGVYSNSGFVAAADIIVRSPVLISGINFAAQTAPDKPVRAMGVSVFSANDLRCVCLGQSA